jgi:hypothetical protein
MVRFIRTTIGTLLALFWVLMISHCRIEAATGLPLLRCSVDVEASSEGDHSSETCGCCSFESAQYDVHRQHEIAPLVVMAIVPADNFGVMERSLPKEVSLGILTAAPPDISTSWQFSLRAALPVRAPSFAS